MRGMLISFVAEFVWRGLDFTRVVGMGLTILSVQHKLVAPKRLVLVSFGLLLLICDNKCQTFAILFRIHSWIFPFYEHTLDRIIMLCTGRMNEGTLHVYHLHFPGNIH